MGSDPASTPGSDPRATTVTTLATRLIDAGLDLAVWWFAAWTVIYHAALGWDLSQSVAIAAMAVAGVAVVVALVRLDPGPDPCTAAPGRPMPRALWWSSLGAAAVAALLMAGRILVPPGWYAAWVLAIAVVPLALPLAGLLRGNPRSQIWATLLALLYLLHGAGEVVANPAERWLGLLEVLLSLSVFCNALLFVRWQAWAAPKPARR